MKNMQLMGHIVAGYPDKKTSIQAGIGISQGGAKFLEVQFPFSDPNADGPIIENACNTALQNGFVTEDGFKIAKTLAHETLSTILIMTYANIVFAYGIQAFLQKAKECGVKALIIPDLPFESDENLRKIAKVYGLDIVELIAPGVNSQRIQKLSKTPSEFVYVVARSGITGSKTQIQKSLFDWISFVKKNCNKKIALGFGIRSNQQIKALQDEVNIIVAGSYFVEKISTLRPSENPRESLKKYTLELLC
ncbi:tryptophan synthase subunit alpha [Helicobacter sp. 11S03491-1]|uniref:tryptophan synthase subunit alpha n=1 Tax=Helicobacter sp. 11S03491-1 TaxID=1476196 RepID=UPI000BA606FD|nr:tryptophan synthase subunit alpha [Helicobacter sp. 11S03491-1]PAF42581.1 tryptophan synthase subunit alpha [Helicobacter sp. 11S03491-1]